jgi:hypothetical protein
MGESGAGEVGSFDALAPNSSKSSLLLGLQIAALSFRWLDAIRHIGGGLSGSL